MAKKNTKNTNKRNKQPVKQTIVRYEPAPKPSIGAMIGDGLQRLGTSLFTKWMGSGDYTCNEGCYDVKTNALIKGSQAKAVRMSSKDSDFVFTHSEYMGDVVTSSNAGAFKQTSYRVNPINSSTFPWLSNIASNFETYEIIGLLFRFVSTSGESVASTNTAIGTVMGTFAYDPLDAPFVSKQQLLQYDDTVSCRFSENYICGVECDKSRLVTFSNKLYVGTPPTGADAKFYDYGNFVVATQGGQAASTNIGELYVSYVIKFHVTKDSNTIPQQLYLRMSFSGAVMFANILSRSGTTSAMLSGGQVTMPAMNVGSSYIVTQTGWTVANSNWSSQTTLVSGAVSTQLLSNNGPVSIFASGLGNGTKYSISETFVATSDVVTLRNGLISDGGPEFLMIVQMIDSSVTY